MDKYTHVMDILKEAYDQVSSPLPSVPALKSDVGQTGSVDGSSKVVAVTVVAKPSVQGHFDYSDPELNLKVSVCMDSTKGLTLTLSNQEGSCIVITGCPEKIRATLSKISLMITDIKPIDSNNSVY